MGFYTRYVFPRLQDRIMAGGNFSKIRQKLLGDAYGETLEIGFGTGLNLPHYPPSVYRLTAIDSNPGMNRLAKKRIAGSAIDVRNETLNCQSVPFDDGTFDCVVSTWTLCSISDVEAALGEINRILKPEGRFFFVEHGLSPDPGVREWQNRLTPIQKVIGSGCHLNRDIRMIIEGGKFKILHLENSYMEGIPRVGGYLYFGSATRSS